MRLPPNLRYPLRHLARSPGLTALVTGTIAIGIAAGATAFGIVNAAFLRPPAVDRAGELVNVYTTRADGTGHGALSYPDYLDLAAGTTGELAGVFGYSGLLATWSDQGHGRALIGELVTGSYFPTLGVSPALGRLLGPQDDRAAGQDAVVVVGHAFWQSRLGGDPDVVGRTLVLNGHPFTVVGVAPASFTGMLFRGFSVDVWAPTSMMGQLRTDQRQNRSERWLFTKARPGPGADVARVRAAVEAIGSRLASEHPDSNEGRAFVVVPAAGVWISPDADGPLMAVSVLLVGACLLALAVGLLNIASMLAARMTRRRRELTVQAALGASRGLLLRQLLVEALVLSGAGGAMGLALTAIAARALSAYRPPLPLPIAFDVRVDPTVLAFVASLALATALVVALTQFRYLGRHDMQSGLRDTAAPATRSRRHWLLVPQVAGSTVLLVLAALLGRSVASASRVDPGFDPAPVGLVTFNLASSGLEPADARAFMTRLTDDVGRMPNVQAVALTNRIPLDLYGSQSGVAALDGGPEVAVQTADVGAGYFEVFSIPLQGRTFTEGEVSADARVAIVNDAFAAALGAGAPLPGRTVVLNGIPRVVVGVAGTVKATSLGEAPTPMVYVPVDAARTGLVRLAVKSTGAPGALVDRVVRAAELARPDVAVLERGTMSEQTALMLLPFEIGSRVAAMLGALAAALAGIGLHGMIALSVAMRWREFGVRLALGASAAQLARAASTGVVRAVATGLGVGLMASAILSRALTSFVFGVSTLDPVSYVAVTLLVLIVAALASAGPVARALRVSPLAALRTR